MDHPHACGDKKSKRNFWKKCKGSSPRVWGQVCLNWKQEIALRIIPTRVGTSTLSLTVRRTMMGSSPRVWGQAFGSLTFSSSNRIIPTRVGTRNLYFFSMYRLKDHPHACGDKSVVNTAM